MGEGTEGRLRWTSRSAFLLAAVGSAVGLGNIWRFPWLSFKYGGGCFLIPYFLALIFCGLPLLMVELGLGRTMQRGDVEAFGRIHRRARGVGVSSIVGGFLIVTYYVNIISWSLIYFVASCAAIFNYPFAWEGQEEDYLLKNVLHAAPEEQINAGASHVISGWVFGGLVFVWAVMYVILAFGVKGVGWVVKVTVPLPVLLIVAMLGYNATLDGAGDGVAAYIGKWDMTGLQDSSVWPAAVGQIFFSNGVALGIMTAYGSYNSESSNIVMDNLLIAVTNSAVSFLAGFAVYTVLGHIAHRAGISVAMAGNVNGVALTFITYPSALSTFPEGLAQFMAIIFFFTLFTLGIDSALSMVEGVITVIHDTVRFRHMKRVTLAAYVCCIGFLLSTMYATDLGLSLIDVVDHYINIYGVMITGLSEAVAVSWIYGWGDMVKRVGHMSASIFTYGYLFSVHIGVILCAGLYAPMGNNMYFAVGVPVGVFCWAVSLVAAYLYREDKSIGVSDFASRVAFAGTEKLRTTINEAAVKYGNWRLPRVWDITVKYLMPPIILGLIVSAAISDATDHTKDFYNYPAWEHALGIAILATMLLSLFGFAVFPGFWEKSFGDEPGVDGSDNMEEGDKGRLLKSGTERVETAV